MGLSLLLRRGCVFDLAKWLLFFCNCKVKVLYYLAKNCVMPICKELCFLSVQGVVFFSFQVVVFFFFSQGFFFSCKGLCFFFARGCFFFCCKGV